MSSLRSVIGIVSHRDRRSSLARRGQPRLTCILELLQVQGETILALTIGTLAASAGCAVDTIRFYQRAGLLPRPPRTRGGHRQYAEAERRRRLVIRRARQLGFNLREIRAVLALADRDAVDCAAARGVAVRHLEEPGRQNRDLETWRGRLGRLIAAWEQEGGRSRPLLDALAGERDPRATGPRPAGRARSLAR